MNNKSESVTLMSVEKGFTDKGHAFIATFSPIPNQLWRDGFVECAKRQSEVEDFYWDKDGRLIFLLVMPTQGPDLLRMAMYPIVDDTNEWVELEENRPKLPMYEILADNTLKPGLDP